MSGGQTVFIFVVQLKSLHCVLRAFCSLAVHLEAAGAIPQSLQWPLAGTSTHYSPGAVRHTSSCVWLWPPLVLLDPGSQFRR